MLDICTNILQFQSFLEVFQKRNESLKCIDLSKLSSDNLVTESDSIVQHHKDCCIFLGYLEPGWMLEPSHQTRIRKLFRKFPVGVVLHHVESLPNSWKNEIDTVYTFNDLKKHGESDSIHNGSFVHNQSKV
jgi:hypothetical protein